MENHLPCLLPGHRLGCDANSLYVYLFLESVYITVLICITDYEDAIVEHEARKQSPRDPTLAQYEAYMNRELPRKVRQELEIAIEKLVGPLEETLKNQLEGLIRNCQEKLSKEYEHSKASSSDKTSDLSSALAGPSGVDESLEISNTLHSGALAPYFIPDESSLHPWPLIDLGEDPSVGAFSDSTYFSNSNVLPPDNHESAIMVGVPPPEVYNNLHVTGSNPSAPVTTLDFEPNWPSEGFATEGEEFYIGKGKGRADSTYVGLLDLE